MPGPLTARNSTFLETFSCSEPNFQSAWCMPFLWLVKIQLFCASVLCNHFQVSVGRTHAGSDIRGPLETVELRRDIQQPSHLAEGLPSRTQTIVALSCRVTKPVFRILNHCATHAVAFIITFVETNI